MAWIQYTQKSLEDHLLLFIRNVETISAYYADYFVILMKTGMRASEPLEAWRFNVPSEGVVTFYPQKGNLIRTIPIESFPEYYEQSLYDQNIFSSRFSLPTLRRYFERHYPSGSVTLNPFSVTSQITFNLFRHYKFKQKMEELNDIQEVCSYFGEVSEYNALNYINSSIYYHSP